MDYQSELADSIDPENYSGGISIAYDRIRHRVANAVLGRLVTYIELLRDSCRQIVGAIESSNRVEALLDDSSFWESFVESVIESNRTEEQWWDLKESLSMWHTSQPARQVAELEFCERVAAFANAEGGVFIIGVSNAMPRRVVGVPKLEDRVKHVLKVINYRLKIDPAAIKVREEILDDENGGTKSCIVLAIAKTPNVVEVRFDDERRSYPVRVSSGLERTSPEMIAQSKAHLKGYDWDFLDRLLPVAREA